MQPSIDFIVKNLHTDEMFSELAEIQESLEPIRSPRQLIALFIIKKAVRSTDAMIEQISSEVEMSKLDKAQACDSFVIASDFNRGIIEVADSVLAAEDYLAHGGHTLLAKKISAIGETVGLPTAEQANSYIVLGSYAKTYAEIVQQDPSGFTLVDRVAQDVETEGEIIEAYGVPVIREFMIDGAKAGALIYKTLYPKAQKILQQ